jgi:type IV pilus assembly protein PilW
MEISRYDDLTALLGRTENIEPKQVNMKKISFNNKGFTLVEIMVSMVIVSLVIAGIYAVYTIQQRTYTVQEQVTEMQQQIRAVLDFMTRDIRMINFNPDDECSGIRGIINATATTFQFDYCEGGNVRNVIYDLVDSDLNRDGITMAQGIDALVFRYFNANGEVTDINNARSVRISMLIRARFPDPRYTNTTQYDLTPDRDNNKILFTPAANDNFHRRLLITTVQLRNM